MSPDDSTTGDTAVPVTRDFGAFRFTLVAQPAAVAVSLSYAGTPLWQASLSPTSAQATLDASKNGATASGELTALFSTGGAGGQLQASDLVLRAPGFETTFTGTVATW